MPISKKGFLKRLVEPFSNCVQTVFGPFLGPFRFVSDSFRPFCMMFKSFLFVFVGRRRHKGVFVDRRRRRRSYVGIFRVMVFGQKGGGSYHRGAPYPWEPRVIKF